MGSYSHSFYRGAHQSITDQLLNQKNIPPKTLPFLIGSLSFLGRLEEAERYYRQSETKISQRDQAACLFFLGVGFSRHSFYEKGRTFFAYNLIKFRHSKSPLIRFYLFQGLGFYRYFQCRYQKAAQTAETALFSATKAQFLYGRYLASDLFGYALVQNGEISRGIENLKNSEKLAKQLGTGSWAMAARVSIVCYESYFGLKPHTILKELQSLYRQIPKDNTFSRSSVLLEEARQWTLRGNLHQSNQILNEACRLIYASRHKRHGVILNLRNAENRYQAAQYYDALNLIRSSFSGLHPQHDRQLMVSLLGMEKKLCQALNIPFDSKNLHALTQQYGTHVARRIANRVQGNEPSPGEDPLGDLLDTSSKNQEKILQSGYLSLLRRELPSSPTSQVLYIGYFIHRLILFDEGNIEILEIGNTTQIPKLLAFLSKGECSKEELVQKLWGYPYHPLQHDSLIYRLIGRLRRLLGKRSFWIEATPKGYQLNHSVSLIFKAELSHPNRSSSPIESPQDWNHRQLQILKKLEKQPFIGVTEVKKIFKISSMTAFRDLAQLTKAELIHKTGKARATRYCLVEIRSL